MWSWNVYAVQSPTTMTIWVPLHYMEILVAALVLFLVWLCWPFRKPWIRVLFAAAVIVFFGCFAESTQLTLDNASGKATLREFSFFHWTASTFPLEDVARLYVRTGNTSDALAIQFTDGNTHLLTFMDQYGGKDRIAYLANRFLGRND